MNIKPTVGDIVDINGGLIVEIHERKNIFVRPAVSNISLLAIVIAPTPAPDLLLLDKQLAYAQSVDVHPIIIVNKADIKREEISAYSEFETYYVSAQTGEGLDDLKQRLKGEVCCFCGQSAVGKSSILNALFDTEQSTGGLSRKTERGKHTTREVSMFVFEGITVLDTPGFSVYMPQIKSEELKGYYPEFKNIKCGFDDCAHVGEMLCGVKEAVEEGKIDEGRYDRYLKIYSSLKEGEKYL